MGCVGASEPCVLCKGASSGRSPTGVAPRRVARRGVDWSKGTNGDGEGRLPPPSGLQEAGKDGRQRQGAGGRAPDATVLPRSDLSWLHPTSS